MPYLFPVVLIGLAYLVVGIRNVRSERGKITLPSSNGMRSGSATFKVEGWKAIVLGTLRILAALALIYFPLRWLWMTWW